MKTINIVLEYWENNTNCARSSVAGILKSYNDPTYKAFYSAFTTYGGGMGEGSICGSVSGTIAAVSKLLHDRGYDDSMIRGEINQMKAHIKNTFNSDSLDCKELLCEFTDNQGVINYSHPDRRTKCTAVLVAIIEYAENILK